MGQKKIRIADLYIYPIKSLCPLSVRKAQLRREGLKYDRRFMLLKVLPDGGYKSIQTVHFPECTLFDQTIEDDGDGGYVIVVTYRIPEKPLVVPPTPEQSTALSVPLDPSIDGLDTVDIDLYGSRTTAYRMGDPYDSWFSSCLGYRAVLVYIGENRRPVLAHSPPPPAQNNSWLTSIASYIPYWPQPAQTEAKGSNDAGLAFNEAAPFLVASKASLRDVSARLPEGEPMKMIKFRPNIVVDEFPEDSDNDNDSDYYSFDEEEGVLGEVEGRGKEEVDGLAAWDEDFWAELLVRKHHRLALTANCARCASINIDYSTGRPGQGEAGTVLKKLMRDRRVDAGNRWSPIFGRYAFLLPPSSPMKVEHSGDEDEEAEGVDEDGHNWVANVAVGDEVEVTRRINERDVWAWPK